ncbi:uncharacterized protein LOC144381189 isoform X2 [Halichoerus grypus]
MIEGRRFIGGGCRSTRLVSVLRSLPAEICLKSSRKPGRRRCATVGGPCGEFSARVRFSRGASRGQLAPFPAAAARTRFPSLPWAAGVAPVPAGSSRGRRPGGRPPSALRQPLRSGPGRDRAAGRPAVRLGGPAIRIRLVVVRAGCLAPPGVRFYIASPRWSVGDVGKGLYLAAVPEAEFQEAGDASAIVPLSPGRRRALRSREIEPPDKSYHIPDPRLEKKQTFWSAGGKTLKVSPRTDGVRLDEDDAGTAGFALRTFLHPIGGRSHRPVSRVVGLRAPGCLTHFQERPCPEPEPVQPGWVGRRVREEHVP